MEGAYQKGQKVVTPQGSGLIEEVNGHDIRVKLESGEIKTFTSDVIEDDSDPG